MASEPYRKAVIERLMAIKLKVRRDLYHEKPAVREAARIADKALERELAKYAEESEMP